MGEFLVSLLGSKDPDLQNERQAEDGLEEVIEQLIDEHGAINANIDGNDDEDTAEANPFVANHDRIFKAFGQ